MEMGKTREMVLCGLFAALMAVGANVAPFLMIGGVPVTLQLMFAIIAGGMLGSRVGAKAMTVYLALGLVGAPVFAQFKGGPSSLLSPTFGFILSFIAVAFAVGIILERNRTFGGYLTAGILALLLNYIIGTNFMYLALTFWAEAPGGFSYTVAWGWMVAYLPLDIVVTTVSLVVLQRLYKVAPSRNLSSSFNK
ncbi:biotin transporter BioY [Rossellomorea aquimaris]|jgi:biotin transport system substrate-specific component|uniref:Biotin transporter n=1 Tax=Rossellomorea aquimaris TaxID=189382 RepID=A0A5D4UN52_9BACI|nr:biotin transporter BioY [Rossellomorea aquimaris]TYS82110.1 biotin transporter BioY [Rossellomorea aquimaris]TYS88734.1 biotin transporter BioY [Rossellomorea aquimaris]